MYSDNNFSCNTDILNCHCLQSSLQLSTLTKDVFFEIVRTCKRTVWLQTDTAGNRRWMERNLPDAGNLNHDAIIHHANTWEIRTDWMQEWRSCVCERERGWHCVLSALINSESRAPETACLRKRRCVVCPFLIGLCDNILVTQRPWRTTVIHALTSTDNKRMMNSWIREFPQDQMNSDFLHIEHRAQRKCVCVLFTCWFIYALIEWIWMPLD